MSDDLDAVIREMWPGLRPGERFLDGERRYSAAWLDDRRLQAVPDKEQGMDKDEVGNAITAVPLSEWAGGKTMPLSDALATLAETVDDDGRIVTHVHDLPIAFFGRADVEKIDILVMEDRVHVTGNLVVGGHKFGCFSKGFPMEAE